MSTLPPPVLPPPAPAKRRRWPLFAGVTLVAALGVGAGMSLTGDEKTDLGADGTDLSEIFTVDETVRMAWNSMESESRDGMCEMYDMDPSLARELAESVLEPVGGFTLDEIVDATMGVL